MEQVLRTVSTLNEAGFTGILGSCSTIVIMFTSCSFTDITMYETLIRPHETSQVSLKSVREVGEHLKLMAERRETKRQRQIAVSRAAKRKRDEKDLGVEDGSKRVKTKEEEAAAAAAGAESSVVASAVDLPKEPSGDPLIRATNLNVSRAFPEVRGHTSYLTFACLVPAVLYKPLEQADTESSTPQEIPTD
jgi:tRNA (adenine57-N1/adenine58-N1)-methyltransferase